MQNYTFISGATGGIGRAFVYECAKKGYNLFITGRSDSKLLELKKRVLKEYQVDILFFSCDLTDALSRQSLLDYIDQNSIRFERIINVAGVDIQKAFTLYTSEKVQFQIRVNVESTICLTHALISRRASGQTDRFSKKKLCQSPLEIITIASMSGVSPMPYFALYSATKASLINFFTSLHYELKPENGRVTVVMPGGVPTRPDIIEDIKGQGIWGKLSSKSPQFVASRSLSAVRKNKIMYIPGGFNKALYFLMKIAPKRIVLSFIAKRWKKISKDAF